MQDRLQEIYRIEMDEMGWVSNLQDFVVHDGPGLRVLIFLRGCPLKCHWCQNPENQDTSPQLSYRKSLCLDCMQCAEVCPVPGAIIKDKEKRVDRTKCIKCMNCIDACLGKALQKVGEQMSIQQVLRSVLPYKPFFDHSDRGGITLSGGDPAFQPVFTLALLRACREHGIHTAVETCGYTKYDKLKPIVEASDLVIYDIKHMDENSHIHGTGISNRLILENLSRLCKEVDTEIVVHIPLISGFNDDEENIGEIAKFVSSLNKIRHVDLLPFNELALEKYRALGINWEYTEVKRQSSEHLARLKEIVESYGLEATVGGLW